jgi:hypothetical protein
MSADRGEASKYSQLFLLRLWPERESGGQMEWHGKVQSVAGDEAHRFRGWTELQDVLASMVLSRMDDKRPK